MNFLQDSSNKSSRQRGAGTRSPDHKKKRNRVEKAEDEDDDALPIGKVLIRKGGRPMKRNAPNSNTLIEVESRSDDSSLPNDYRVSRFREGDMVWAKVKSHPWWPGQIYNPAFATATAKRSRRSGHVLVAFFGDATFGWFVEANLIPFEPTFREKSKQTVSRSFIEAVEDAVDELHRRAALGLLCNCRNNFNYASAREGYVKVSVPGWEQPVVYPNSLVKEARDGFRPEQMLDFVKRMAVSPWCGEDRNVGGIKSAGEVRAYRAATAVPVCAKYREDLGILQRRSEGVSEIFDVAIQQLPDSAKGTQREAVARFSVKDQNGHSKLTDGERLSITEGQAGVKEDMYLFKRREIVNEKQYCASGGSLMNGIKKIEIDQETKLLGDAVETDDVSNYVFKKRSQQEEAQTVEKKTGRKKAEQGLHRERHGFQEAKKRKRETTDQTSHLEEVHGVENKEERKKAEEGLTRERHGIREVKRKKGESIDQTSNREKEAQTVDNKEVRQEAQTVDNKEVRKKAGQGFYREQHDLQEIKRRKKETTDVTLQPEKKNSADKHSLKRRIIETEALKDCPSNTDLEIPHRVRLKLDCDDSNKKSLLIQSVGCNAPWNEVADKVPKLLPKKKHKKTARVRADSEEINHIGQTKAFTGSLLNTEQEIYDEVGNVSRKTDKSKNESSTKDNAGSNVPGVLSEKSSPKASSKKNYAKVVPTAKDLTGTVLHRKDAPGNILSEKTVEGGGDGITNDRLVQKKQRPDLGNSKPDAVDTEGNISHASLQEGLSAKSDRFEVGISIGLTSANQSSADARNLLCFNNGAHLESEVIEIEDIPNIDDSATLMSNQLQYDACHDSHLKAMHSNDKSNLSLEKKASCDNLKIPSTAEGQGTDSSLELVSENTNANLLKLDDVIKGQIGSYAESKTSQISEPNPFDGHSVIFDVEKYSPGAKDNVDNICQASEISTDVGSSLRCETNVVTGTGLVFAGKEGDVVCQSPKLKPISDDIVVNKSSGLEKLVISALTGVKDPCNDNSQLMPTTTSKHAMNSSDKQAVGDVHTDKYDSNHASHPDGRGEVKEDDKGCSTLPSGEDQGFESFERNVDPGFLLHQLVNDLRSIAIDPFYGIKWGCQVDISRVFLRFRSSVYEKIQDSSYIEETSMNVLPSVGTETDKKEDKVVEKPSMSLSGYVDANGADASSNAVVGSNSTEAAFGPASTMQPITKLSNNTSQTNEAGSQAKENKKIKLGSRSHDHSKSSKKAYSSPEKSSLKTSAKRHSGIYGRDSREPVRHKKRLSQSSDTRKILEEPMALSMKFPQGFALPSEAQLKARFVRFGQLDISGTRIYCHSNCARVVFKCTSDAEAAYKYATKNSLFGQANVKYKLKQMFHPKKEAVSLKSGFDSQNKGIETMQGSSELPKVRKHSEEVPSSRPDVKFNMLEASIRDEPLQLPDIEINDSCPLVPSDGPMVEEASDDSPLQEAYSSPLVQLKSCLKKPDESGNNNIKESTRVTFLLDKEHRPDILDMKNGFSQIESCRDSLPVVSPSHNSAIAPDPPDISNQMMYVLKKCNEIVGDIKSSVGYVPYHLFSSST